MSGYVKLILEMSALLALLIAVWPLLARRVSAARRYGICLVVLVALLIPVRPSLPASPIRVPNSAVRWAEAAVEAAVQPAAAPEEVTASPVAVAIKKEAQPDAMPAQADFARRIDPRAYIRLAWLTGVLAMLGVSAFRYARLLALLRRCARAVDAPETLAEVALAADAVGLKRLPRVMRCPLMGGPFVVGLVRPMLVLPMDWQADPIALRHELTHLRRGDLLAKWLMLLVRAVHWYNPLVWWFLSIAQAECELSCDELALRNASQVERSQYAHAVLRAASGKTVGTLALGSGEGRIQMKRRLMLIVDPINRGKGRAALALVMALMLFAGQWVAAGAEMTEHEREIRGRSWYGDPAKILFCWGMEYSPLEHQAIMMNEWLAINHFAEGRTAWDGYEGKTRLKLQSWKLVRSAEMKPGWEPRALNVAVDYVDAEGRDATVEIVLAYAVNRDEPGYCSKEQDLERLTPLVEAALSAELQGGVYKSHPSYYSVEAALESVGARALQGTLYCTGPMKNGDEDETHFISGYSDLLALDQLNLSNKLFRGGFGITTVKDSRDLTWDNAGAILEELVKTHVGSLEDEARVMTRPANGSAEGKERVMVQFANGSLVDLYLNAPLGEASRDVEDRTIGVFMNLRFAQATGLTALEAEAQVGAVVDRVLAGVERPEDAEAALRPALAEAFGLTAKQVDEAFQFYNWENG